MAHKVIDIFAGPGGLSEGFASFTDSRGNRPFEIGVSAEMEASAHATLSLRALGRRVDESTKEARAAYKDLLRAAAASLPTRLPELASGSPLARDWKVVSLEVLRLTLGVPADNGRLEEAISAIARPRRSGLVLIGGPPCQAYSLVGRARNRGVKGYRPEADKRHFLYEQYLAILEAHRPDVFIMENVKGILSSEVQGNLMFERILDDLRRPGGRKALTYQLVALASSVTQGTHGSLSPEPRDFIVRAERLGIPQARHRVIIMGVRQDSHAYSALKGFHGLSEKPTVCLGDILADLPPLRSGLSQGDDSAIRWKETMEAVQSDLVKALRKSDPDLAEVISSKQYSGRLSRNSDEYSGSFAGPSALRHHYRGARDHRLLNHETRGHMKQDLARYLFCSAWGELREKSPTSGDFPPVLRPDHRSWSEGHFADRFRVQLPQLPGKTVTSHLAKDGHQFIHWDAEQCRSLTVREAARIQTFPDEYVFLGNRTQQYTQVGNAVPPLLAQSIASAVNQLLS